tara:strand:+ start:229 stop:2418 length:2190 start_codon:yes stop_codon:yes gene_type:complete
LQILRNAEIYTALSAAILVSVLLSLKIILFDGCLGFDTNDDVNHTFVNLHVVKQSLAIGEVPKINLFNNFGTPLLGDALTYPFGLQALTYWFADYPIAMSINRCLAAFCTMLVLILFFRQFFRQWVAILCSLLTLFAPGPLWNLAHHHYQMSLLFFVAILLLQGSRSLDFRWKWPLLFSCYIMFYMSVSINIVAVSLPFLASYLFFKEGCVFSRGFFINIGSIGLAGFATLPLTFEFKELISESVRLGWSPYSGILPTIREQLLGLIIPPGEWMYFGINGHFSVTTYFSLPVIMATVIGIVAIITHNVRRRELLGLALCLGFIPAILAFFIQFYGERVTVFQSVDMTRVWWFSNIFVFLGIGAFLELLSSGKHRGELWFVGIYSICLLMAVVFHPILTPELVGISNWHFVVMIIPSVPVALLAVFQVGKWLAGRGVFKESRSSFQEIVSNIGALSIGFCLILSLVPTIYAVLGLASKNCEAPNHYFAVKQHAKFQPENFLSSMEENYRMAAVMSPVRGFDLKAVFGQVLGSNSRSIVSSKNFRDSLVAHNLITIDDNYFFSPPWQFEKLNSLGIRYLITIGNDDVLDENGWEAIAESPMLGGLVLYENPNRPSLVRYQKDGGWVNVSTYLLRPNSISVELPRTDFLSKLQVSFFNRRGWAVEIDGKVPQLSKTELGMIEVPFAPGDRALELVYKGIAIPIWIRVLSTISMGMFVFLWVGIPRRIRGENG